MFRKTIVAFTFVGLMCCACASFGRAQGYPTAEAYLGFTDFNNAYGTDRHNSPGVVMNFGYNVARNVRLVGDFGAEFHSTNIVWTNGRKASADDYQLLFGPEFTIRTSPKVTPFVHGLVGVAFRNYAVPTGSWICTGLTCYENSFSVALEKGFAAGVGGGIDWNFHPNFSFRVVQFDWIRSHLSRDNSSFSPAQGSLPVLQGWQDNYRFSCGFTIRWGNKE